MSTNGQQQPTELPSLENYLQQDLVQAKQHLASVAINLENHIHTDWDAIEAELRAIKTHLEGKVQSIEAKIKAKGMSARVNLGSGRVIEHSEGAR